ncbi:hypothetical protein N9381_12460 [Paracoccaceae bacterium]|jgi:hypothetical protein|nr:hypothetical protein [Paracoccaceae bacterium]MBT6300238.1 hypothetical protein [Paracoccaceae bacterium]MDB3912565.1 hypothetical protein [Paracoccaceae bacterium]HBS38521.1 hypothetical protein [Paracoccaceae bacterium]|tara:strand:- start:1845 stop:2261 length:417 start_codon:yes stop_codon:yes gene_type:complete
MEKSEFSVMGKTMEQITIFYGAFLIAWAVLVSLIGQSESWTSLIPALFGLPIAAMGLLTIRMPEKTKLFMHIAVTLGLIVCLGGLDFLRGFGSEGGPFSNPWAGLSKLVMAVTGAGYVYLCVKSFIFARKMRESADAD